MRRHFACLLLLTVAGAAACAHVPVESADVAGPEKVGREAVLAMAGCYVVDYSFHETRALQPGYAVDPRVYDVNGGRTALEWVFPELPERKAGDRKPVHRIRLQHVLFLLDSNGHAVNGSLIRHQAEDWDFQPEWVWDYAGHSRWRRRDVQPSPAWVRRITHLDDGLRYQCLAPWTADGVRHTWTCSNNFAPIPGRETRDMQRHDYQALVRGTKLNVFFAAGGPGAGKSASTWLEQQVNVKTVVTDTERKPLAEEVGRSWYVRAPDALCREAARWSQDHLPFWKLLETTWAEEFAANTSWAETPPGKGTPRWAKLAELEEQRYVELAADPAQAPEIQKQIRAVIEADREADRVPEAGAPSMPVPAHEEKKSPRR